MAEANTKEERTRHENIFAALSAFQGELKPMPKSGHVEFATSSGKTVKYDYTPLGEIMAIIYPLLSKHGLSVRHEITNVGVEAVLTHETYRKSHIRKDVRTQEEEKTEWQEEITGELRSGIVDIKKGSEMKDTGAAITYARRYTLTMVLGISSEDDKDAELLEQTAKNAMQSSFERMKKGIEGSKTVEDVEKAMKVVKKDLEAISKGKAPSLGLTKEAYLELELLANSIVKRLTEDEPTIQ